MIFVLQNEMLSEQWKQDPQATFQYNSKLYNVVG